MKDVVYSPYHRLVPERLEVLYELAQFKSEKHAKIELAERTLFTQVLIINPKAKDTLLITAGCHGNEPAPVYAVLQWLLNGKFPGKRIVLVPCIVPYGFATHIDRNSSGVDINRDFFSKTPQQETRLLKNLVAKYTPSLALNLHEDPDEHQFFVYSYGATSYAKKVIRHAKLPTYKRKVIHGDIVTDGIVEDGKSHGSFEDYLREQGIPNLCIETPGTLQLRERMAAYMRILQHL
jgi:predicted deacylase